jgi:hypothetical protein
MADTISETNVSNDVDINVMTSMDGENYDNVAYTETNLGDNERKTILVNPGPAYMRLRADNNHATDAAKPAAEILIRE